MRQNTLATALMCVVCVTFTGAGSASAFSFHAGAGPTVLTGDISQLWNTGLSLRGYGYNRLSPQLLLGFGVDVNWHTMDEEAFFYGAKPSGWGASGNLFMIEIGPTLRFQPESSGSKNRPFFGKAGLSFYRMGWTTSVQGSGSGYRFRGALSGDKNQFGLTLGGGLAFGRFELLPLLHVPFDDSMYISLTGGIVLGK